MKDSHSADPQIGPKGAAADRIAADLTRAVHEHRLLPGLKLGEDEVGEIFGAGRTVVRQALRMLEGDGLVRIERNRGAFVAKPTAREAREVFEARALLEPTMARVAAGRAGPDDIALLRGHIAEEHAALACGATGRALMLSGHFHVEIARIAGQETIAAFVRQLVSRSALVIALYWRRQSAMCERHAHHALIEALARRDGPAAEEMMKGHLVDLLSLLDLTERPDPPPGLRAALAP